jgi:hypothetical protein
MVCLPVPKISRWGISYRYGIYKDNVERWGWVDRSVRSTWNAPAQGKMSRFRTVFAENCAYETKFLIGVGRWAVICSIQFQPKPMTKMTTQGIGD